MSAPRFDRWRNAYARIVAAATLFLVFAGGLVTSTGSGLAVPDWPLSYGTWFPPMVGGVFYEHGHRMIAGAVGVLTFVLTAWTLAAEDRRSVRRLAGFALFAVVVQALLGGLTVLLLLPTAVSVAHACLGQTFLCLVVALAAVTGRSWLEETRVPAEDDSLTRAASIAMVALVCAQLVLGALMRHLGAGLAIPDFPLAFGRLVPEIATIGVAIHFAHRVGAVVVTLAAVALVLRTSFAHRGDAWIRRPTLLLLALVAVQATLGALTIWSGKAVLPTTTHVATGAAVLATSVVFALRAHGRFGRQAASETVTARRFEGARA